MKLGLQLGYWGAQPPAGRRRARRGRRGVRVRRGLHRRGVGLRRVHPAGLVGARDRRGCKLGTSIVQMSGRTPTSIAMHALTLDHLSGGRVDPRHGRERSAGRRGVVRPAVRQAAGPHPRGRRHHPPGAGPRGAGDQRRPALPAAVHRRGRRSGSASRSSRSCTRCAPTCRSGSAPRARRTSRRPPRSPTAGSRSSTRRKSAGDVPAVARRGLRPAGRAAYPGRLRDRRDLPPRRSPTTEEQQASSTR